LAIPPPKNRNIFCEVIPIVTSNHDIAFNTNKAEFDSEELLERIENDRDLFKEVIRIFVQDTPGLISLLGDGISERNGGRVEKAAHTIKGSCAMISAKRLEGLAHQLEMMGRENDLTGAEAVYQDVIDCFNDLKQIMMATLEKMQS